MIPILLLVTATFRPPAPTVGDLITIDFQQAVTLDRSPQYEIVSQRGSRVVIRTFEPLPFTISGRVGDVLFRNMVVPVHSVLKARDNLAPAPLKPPLAEGYPKLPFVIMGIAAFLAIVAWTAVVLLERRAAAARAPQPAIPPGDRFRAAVMASRTWSQLADALREYLAATTELGMELTTYELLGAVEDSGPPLSGQPRAAVLHTVAEILHQGDLEKFSPWGARPGDLAAAANRALDLLSREEEEEVAA